MADLRILEEQQVESQRNLQNAYATKQRLLDHQDALDAKLNQCKYHYGQKRAELQRSHELLSEGQRKLMTARSAAAKADADLREFDRKLTFVRESESSLRADQRTLDRLLEEFRGQKATMDRRVQKANEQLEQAQHQFDKARHHEENLRQGIRNETASQTNLADQTAESRAESAAQEQACDHTLKLEKSLKLQVENIQKKKDDERARGANVNDDDAEDLQIGKHKQFVHQTAETKAQLKNAAAQKKAYLNQIWHETIEIQKAEGHTPSLPSTESNVPPDLDLNRIRASVQGEAEAAMDETRAKEHLKASVESLQKRLWDLTGEHSTTSDTLKELEASYEIAVKNEKDRKASNDALLAELEQVTESFKEKTRMRGELLSVQDTELAALKKELAAVSLEGCTTEENLEQSHKQCVAIDTDITNVQATYTDMKALDQNKLEDMEQELGQSRQQCRDLQEKVSRIDDRLQTNEIKEQRARRKEVDEANRKIASILESK